MRYERLTDKQIDELYSIVKQARRDILKASNVLEELRQEMQSIHNDDDIAIAKQDENAIFESYLLMFKALEPVDSIYAGIINWKRNQYWQNQKL